MEEGEVETPKKKKKSPSCTHAHTCNPPGPDGASHSHTCFHSHTFLLPEGGENCQSKGKDESGSWSALRAKKWSSGNREAVRKYREKKKAHAAYLEEEVKRLRALNHHLLRKLQSQATLEDEVIRLRGLLVDLRGKIDTELGLLSFQKPCSSGVAFAFMEGVCNKGDVVCQPATVDCKAHDTERQNSGHT